MKIRLLSDITFYRCPKGMPRPLVPSLLRARNKFEATLEADGTLVIVQGRVQIHVRPEECEEVLVQQEFTDWEIEDENSLEDDGSELEEC